MRALLLLAALLGTAYLSAADEELCVGRCKEGFNATHKCQCDPLCVYYQSCCIDYATTCKQKVTRGDVFALPEDDYELYDEGTGRPLIEEEPMATESMVTETLPTDPMELDPTESEPMEPDETDDVNPEPVEIEPVQAEVPIEKDPEQVSTGIPASTTSTASSFLEPKPPTSGTRPSPEHEEKEDACSQKPFDAFTDLKNGSIFAFRGKYCYELDEKQVIDGYPKLIEDVWGIPGPIDAAFTRINCEGKTYMFKGNQYWRFHNGILDGGYPRNISNGFKKIPDDIDAAFAVPAKDYKSTERAYFFKGSRYWEYTFSQQPNIQECQNSPPSMAFTHYALMQTDDVWSKFFQQLFGSSAKGGTSDAKSISRGWRGLPSNLDAAVAGKIYVSEPSRARVQKNRRRKSRKNRRRYQLRKRKSWYNYFDDWALDEDDDDDLYIDPDWQLPITQNCQPIQSIYFFKKDKYYRVNLQKKRVDFVFPRYPRSIAQYWLGCRNLRRLK